ncbi:MAG: hypothetical protein ABW155_01330 [Candidatus Thiodiazotropha sp.]
MSMVIMAQISTNDRSGSLTTIVHSQTKRLLLANYRGGVYVPRNFRA